MTERPAALNYSRQRMQVYIAILKYLCPTGPYECMVMLHNYSEPLSTGIGEKENRTVSEDAAGLC